MTQKWIDLSQEYHENMPPRSWAPEYAFNMVTVRDTLGEVGGYHMQQFTFPSHLGTHIDAPKHMFRGGISIDQIPVERFVGSGVVLDIPKKAFQPITATDLEDAKPEAKKGDIVIIRTGWGERMWHNKDYRNCPYLTVDAAEWLVKKQISIIGVDMNTVDLPIPLRTEGFDFPVHRMLLGNDILIVENLGDLSVVAGKRLTILALPLKIEGADGSPVRVTALLE